MNAMDIIREVAAKHRVTMEQLRGPGRTRRFVNIRREIYQRLIDERKLSFTKIGQYFNRDHTTIIHALNRHFVLRNVDCRNCGTSFETLRTGKLYCSRECAKQWHAIEHRNNYQRVKHRACCKHCGVEFEGIATKVYCSKLCGVKARCERIRDKKLNALEYTNCEHCNQQFKTFRSVQRFCSLECQMRSYNLRRRSTEAGARSPKGEAFRRLDSAGAGPDISGVLQATGVQNGDITQGSQTSQINSAAANADIRATGHGQNDTCGGVPEYGVPAS